MQVWLQGGHLGGWRCRVHSSDWPAAIPQVTVVVFTDADKPAKAMY